MKVIRIIANIPASDPAAATVFARTSIEVCQLRDQLRHLVASTAYSAQGQGLPRTRRRPHQTEHPLAEPSIGTFALLNRSSERRISP